MPDARCTRGRVCSKSTRVSNQGYTATTGIPCTMVLTVSFVLFPVTIAWLPPSPVRRRKRLHDLSACVGAPEPHDFAVRDLDDRLTRGRVHRIPLPTFVTIAKRPSSRPRDAWKGARDLPDGASASRAACWRDGQIAHCVHARRARRARSIALDD